MIRGPGADSYDVVVIGSGIGGLTAGAVLAAAGRRVLIVEQHDRPGGYAHSFRRHAYRFDGALHAVAGCGPDGLLGRLLRSLGVEDHCRFVPLVPFYSAIFPGLRVQVPAEPAAFLEAHTRAFPAEREGLASLLQLCTELHREAAPARILDGGKAPRPMPLHRRYLDATLAAVLGEHLRDPEARAVFGALWPYLGLPPSRLSFLAFADMLMSYLIEGAFGCAGTFQRLAWALVEASRRRGGELVLRRQVRRILVQGGRAVGVDLDDGRQIRSEVVISNADALQTLRMLPPAVSAGCEEPKELRPSSSAFVVYSATRLRLEEHGATQEMLFYDGWDADICSAPGRPDAVRWMSVHIPTLADPSVAPPGEHLAIISTAMAYDAVPCWSAVKDHFTHQLLDRVEARFPGFRAQLRFAEGGTPHTLERYTGNAQGACYGWELSPDQSGPGRPRNRASIEGLYRAGHWTRPGAGIYSVVLSGLQAAHLIMR